MKKIGTAIALLAISSIFMNFAWYAHLKFKESPIWIAILASWGLALFEYIFQVPANRIGSETLTLTKLKVTQEVISLVTFVIVAWALYKEKPTWTQGAAFVCIAAGAWFASMPSK